jgi:hypothetical protein
MRALLVAMLVVAAFFAGMVAQRRLDEWRYPYYQVFLEAYSTEQ